MHYIVVYFKFL